MIVLCVGQVYHSLIWNSFFKFKAFSLPHLNLLLKSTTNLYQKNVWKYIEKKRFDKLIFTFLNLLIHFKFGFYFEVIGISYLF